MTVATASARNMHTAVLTAVVRAPVTTFFDVTSGAEIINRFSSDLERVDMLLPDFVMQLLQNLLHSIGIILLCAVASPMLIAVLIPLMWGGRKVFLMFRAVFRDLKRMEGVSRTPVYSTFSETLGGLETIRAYSAAEQFRELMAQRVDRNSERFLLFRMAGLWLMWRLDLIASLIILALSLLLVATKDSVNGSLAGLALVYAMQLTALLQRVIFVAIETETHFTSAERIIHCKGGGRGPDIAVHPEPASLTPSWRPLPGIPSLPSATCAAHHPPVDPGAHRLAHSLALRAVTLAPSQTPAWTKSPPSLCPRLTTRSRTPGRRLAR